MLLACFKIFLYSVFSFQGKIIRSRWMFNIKFIVCLITESFNYFIYYYFLIYFCSVKYQYFIQYVFGLKLNSPLITLLTFCLHILPSIYFILFLGCLSFLVAFLDLSLGWAQTCLIFFVFFLNLSWGWTGTCLINLTFSLIAANFLIYLLDGQRPVS